MLTAAVESVRPSSWRALDSPKVCLVVVTLAAASAVTCTQRAAQPAPDATLRIGARGSGEAPKVIVDSLFAEPLFVIDQQGRPAQRLATEWQWDDDGLALTVRLRPGIRFHDGGPLTSEVAAAVIRQQMGKKGARGFEAIKQIDTPDAKTLVFRLTRKDVFLIGTLANTPIVDDNKPDIGTGPFRIVARTPAVEADKNASYYRGTPGIDHVRIVPYDTPRAAWAGLMRGDVDMAHEVNRESVEFLEGASRVELYSSIRPFYIPLVFNLHHPILGRVEVRRAIAEAINRTEIVEQAMRGRGQIADDPVWPLHWAYNPAARRYTYNPAAARERLDDAGLPVRPAVPGSGRMASRFQITLLFFNEEPPFERIALMLQRQLAAVDIDLVLQGASQKAVVLRAAQRDFECYLFQMTSGRSFDWTYRFWHSPPPGAVEFQNTGYTGADAVLDRLREARADADVRIAVGDLRQRFYEDVPAAFLAWMQTTRAVDARFDVGDRSDPDVFANLWRWRAVERQRASR